MSIGSLVKLLRISKNFNQKTASQKLGISQQAYSKLEARQYINKIALLKVLEAFKSSPEEWEKLKKSFIENN